MYVIHDFFQLWFYHTEVTCAVHGILKIQEVTDHEQFLGHKRLSYKNNKKQKQWKLYFPVCNLGQWGACSAFITGGIVAQVDVGS